MENRHDNKVHTISHIMLGVSNLAASLEFYCQTLGLEVAFQSPGFAFVNAGSVTIGLSEPMLKATGRVSDASEIVFGVDGVESVHAGLVDKGVAFTQEPRQVTPDQWAANFDDPDGHHLSIFGPKDVVDNP